MTDNSFPEPIPVGARLAREEAITFNIDVG
ncbi:hypothetical protein PS874_02434 [Pseudomonas fluorescens]|jgi:hypothetical protein|nr:hypothetical protein PS874_02434 [Pseudomonas fluorescens]